MIDEARDMSLKEQIIWYLDRMDSRKLKSVLLYVFKLFLGR